MYKSYNIFSHYWLENFRYIFGYVVEKVWRIVLGCTVYGKSTDHMYHIFKTHVCILDFDTKAARGLALGNTFLCTTSKYLNSMSQQASNVFHYNCYLTRHNPLSYKYILRQSIAKWENNLMEALLSCLLHNLPWN